MNNRPITLRRFMTPAVEAALGRFPVVVLTGARQTGKTTLVNTGAVARGRTFRSLDDLDVLDRARQEPDALLQDAEHLTLDEVQRTPELLLAIKRDVDRQRRPGRFLLTGSANLLMMRRVSESLSGRAVHLTLWPMTQAELQGRPSAGPWSRWISAVDVGEAMDATTAASGSSDWPDRVHAGGFPVPALDADRVGREQWFDGYVRTYLERDLQDLATIASLPGFRRLMRLAALRIGNLLNQSELSRDAAIPQATAHRYLNLMETSYQIVRLPAYAVTRSKRLIKSPKLYWTDTGLACHLTGASATLRAKPSGALLENLVLSQMLAWREAQIPRPEVHYWRTHGGHEVDFVIEAGRRLLPIEVKSASRARTSDAVGLTTFLDEYPDEAPFGIVLYGGAECLRLTERVFAVPLASLWAD